MTTTSAAPHLYGLYGRGARQKPLLSKMHMTVHLEFAKRHLKESQIIRNKILWSDEAKIKLFGLDAEHHAWRKQDTAHHLTSTFPTVNHFGGSIILWRWFSGECSNVQQCSEHSGPWTGQRLIFRQDYDLKHTAKLIKEWPQSGPLCECLLPDQTSLERSENSCVLTIPTITCWSLRGFVKKTVKNCLKIDVPSL